MCNIIGPFWGGVPQNMAIISYLNLFTLQELIWLPKAIYKVISGQIQYKNMSTPAIEFLSIFYNVVHLDSLLSD